MLDWRNIKRGFTAKVPAEERPEDWPYSSIHRYNATLRPTP
jgi:hypothetical protein